jgi:tRNA uridine 5-carboxymethylaminomethyl modification enzyme
MFTSRAEYRLILREDNADMRLTEHGRRLGLVDDGMWDRFVKKRDTMEDVRSVFGQTMIGASRENEAFCAQHGVDNLSNGVTIEDLLKRNEVDFDLVRPLAAHFAPGLDLGGVDDSTAEAIEVEIMYSGYIDRQKRQIEEHREMESKSIPDDLDYEAIHGLSYEIRERLESVRPHTVGQASRIVGVTPAAISALLVHMR